MTAREPPTSTVRIRDLAWGDFVPLVENYYALYEEVRENPDVGISLFHVRPTFNEEVEGLASLFRTMRDGDTIAAVADVDGRAVALCHVNRVMPRGEGNHTGELGILVAREHRGQGVGRARMRYVIDRCRGRFEQVELAVFVPNDAARRLYRSLGFRPWGVLPRAIKRGGPYLDVERMVLDLGPGTMPGPPDA